MELTRRTLLGASTAVGAGLLLPLRLTEAANAATPPNVLTPFTEQLPTLANLGVIDATTSPAATISMENASHSFHSAMAPTPTFTYRAAGGTQDCLGPVIVAKKGVPFDLTVTNNLGNHPLSNAIDTGIMGATASDATAPRTSVHLHGGNTSPENDGDPTDVFGTGTAKVYHYANTQESAGLWYHDHALGITRLNVFAGLASGYLVRDANDPGDGSTGLPPAVTAGKGDYEVPLILQDRMFNTDGTFLYPVNPTPPPAPFLQKWIPEFFGDVATVNGKVMPNLNVNRGKYRFRVLNGSQARFYNLKLKTSLGTFLTFFQIGTDGGLLNAPVPLTKLLLAPGERADVVVDFAALPARTKVVLSNDANTPFPSGPTAVKKGGMPLPQIMQFSVGSAAGWTVPLPTNLRAKTAAVTSLAGLAAALPPAQRRNVELVELHDPLGNPLIVLLNNSTFDSTNTTPTVTPKTNTLEQWDFVNTTVDAHPMHLHFTQFQVLNRQKYDAAGYLLARFGPRTPATAPIWPVPNTSGTPTAVTPFLIGNPSPPPPNEQGWKDTIVAMPGEVTRILVPFGATITGTTAPMAIGTSYTGNYVSHCHILEHEENDMMLRYRILP